MKAHAVGAIASLLVLGCVPAVARADAPPATDAATATAPAEPAAAPAPAPRRWIAHLNFGLVAYNWLGASGSMPSKGVSISDRQTILQLAGVGYFVLPSLRVMLSVQVAEIVGGAAPGQSAFAIAGVIPWVAWHPISPLFVGAGPFLAPRSYSDWKLDAGVFTCVGVVFPVGLGFALGGAVQVPIMFVVRPAITIAPAVFAAYRF